MQKCELWIELRHNNKAKKQSDDGATRIVGAEVDFFIIIFL